MKKLTTLVLAAGLVVSSFAGSASAGEFRPFAQFAEEFIYGDGDPAGANSHENFGAATRIRFGFDYIQSEDLSATMMFQYRKGWGVGVTDFSVDPSVEGLGYPDHFRMRLAYIDWTIPTTDVKVRMGRQAVVTPSYAFGSAILDGRGDAVSINGNVNDNITLGATWLRLTADNQGYGHHKDSDAFMLQAEFAYDGWKVAPWGMYIVDQGSGLIADKAGNAFELGAQHHSTSFVLGASFELSMFDPFIFALDALYSNTDYSARNVDSYDGFYVGAKAAYKLNNGTVALKAWYATGDDDTGNTPNDNGFVVLDGGFNATTILYGDNIIGADDYNTMTGDSPFGSWGVVLEYAGFSFMDKLSHTARVAYITGTNDLYTGKNDRPLKFDRLTKDDTLIEVDFNSTYEIYQNLSATLELGYVFVDMANLNPGVEEHDDIMRAGLTFVYNF